MSERYSFRVHYSEKVLRRAVYAYAFRALGGKKLLLSILAVGFLYAAYLIVFGGDGKFAGFVSAFVLCSLGYVVLYCVLSLRQTLGALKRMKTPEAQFTLTDEAISVAADIGASTIPWSSFREILACDGCWLLLLASSRYVSLPTAGVPVQALTLIRSRIPRFSILAGRAEDAARAPSG